MAETLPLSLPLISNPSIATQPENHCGRASLPLQKELIGFLVDRDESLVSRYEDQIAEYQSCRNVEELVCCHPVEDCAWMDPSSVVLFDQTDDLQEVFQESSPVKRDCFHVSDAGIRNPHPRMGIYCS